MSKTNPTVREQMYAEYREFRQNMLRQIADTKNALRQNHVLSLVKMLQVASTGTYTAQEIADRMGGLMNARQVAANMAIFRGLTTIHANNAYYYYCSVHRYYFNIKKFKVKALYSDLMYRKVNKQGEPYGPVIIKENAGPTRYQIELMDNNFLNASGIRYINL